MSWDNRIDNVIRGNDKADGKLLGSDPLVTDPIQRTPFDGPTITGGFAVTNRAPVIDIIATNDSAEQIVRELAARGPFLEHHNTGLIACADCG